MPVKRFKGAKAKADKLFSEIVRSIGECEAAGYAPGPCSNQLQCMHIISRRYSATRTDLRNAFSGCASHHRYYTDHPREFSKFISETWAQEYYDHVYRKSQGLGKVDWIEEAERLKELKKQLDSGELTLDRAREKEM